MSDAATPVLPALRKGPSPQPAGPVISLIHMEAAMITDLNAEAIEWRRAYE
jgi:hypothetical protein